METRTLIQAQANVLRVTALKKGDVLKIVEKEYSAIESYYGVVIDLLNSGNESFIQILRYKKSYNDFTAEIKTYSGDKNLALFPTSVDEVKEHFDDVIKALESEFIKKRKELEKNQEALQSIKEFVNGEKSKKLTDSSFVEITQEQYNIKKAQLEALKAERI